MQRKEFCKREKVITGSGANQVGFASRLYQRCSRTWFLIHTWLKPGDNRSEIKRNRL